MENIVFLGFNLHAWITIATVLGVFSVLLFTRIRADLVFVSAMFILLVTGVLSEADAFSGFSNSSTVVVGVLFVVVAGLMHTGVLHWIVKNLLGQPKRYSGSIARLMLPVAGLSSFLSNTTVVALFVDIVKMWSKKLGISPSKLLIPLSYASGMGGICTLIGTPPNLIISGLYTQNTHHVMNVLSTTVPGLFCLAVGILSVIALRKLLPDRKAPENAFEDASEYTVEFLVHSDNPNIGKSVQEASLSDLKGGSLIEIIRAGGEVISPVAPEEIIMSGDRLVFAGQIEDLLDLEKSHSFAAADRQAFSTRPEKRRNLQTAYISFGSSLINKTIHSSGFERENHMTLIAVSRKGERIAQSPREVVLQAGDTLLLECSPKADLRAAKLTRQVRFFDSGQISNIGPKTLVSGLIMIAMVALSATNVLPLASCAFLAAVAMLVFRCCNAEQAMKAVNWEVLMVFAGSVVLGLAIQKTGIAEKMANGILAICGKNPIVVMAGVCLVATFITEFISNTAAGAIFFPIMYQAATALGYDPYPFMIALMIAVSSSFATPIGSPTHMLVYAPGGYRFSDFIKIGVLMNIIILAANIFIVSVYCPFTPMN